VVRVVGSGAILAFVLVHACGYDWSVVPSTPCSGAKECAPGAYCRFEDGLCGKGARGRCVARDACVDKGAVCGCSGTKYASACAAANVGEDVGACGGAATCDCPRDSYCLDVGGAVTCVPFTCAERSCACKETTAKCAGACSTTADGAVVVRCKE